MRTKRTVKNALFVLAVALLLSAAANAETTFHAETPGNKISAREAAKLMQANKDIYRCRAVKEGPSINPVVDSKAPTTWHTAIGKDLGEAALDRLTKGQRLVRCEAVYIDKDSMRVRKAE